MKFSKQYRLLIIVIMLSAGCGGDDPKPDEAGKIKKLLTSGTWKLQSLTIDSDDQTALYEDLAVRFTATGYTSSGGEPVWPALGTWSFMGEATDQIVRDDEVVVTILTLNENNLSLELIWNDTTLGSGRATALSGVHVFTFTQ